MAKITIDLSGRRGLVERYQGDLNDTSAQPHLRYLGVDGQFADGMFNPFKQYGFLSPANAKFASLTGSIAAGINSIQYDADNDIVYLSEEGENILKLDGLDDTSLANHLSVSSGTTIKDMLVYEINQEPVLIYAIDSGGSDGMYVGFDVLDGDSQIRQNDYPVESVQNSGRFNQELEDDSGSRVKFAQAFNSDDVPTLLIERVRLRIARSNTSSTSFTLKVSIQTDESANSGIYTSQGAWADATAYAVNDTVTNDGETYSCHTAHTSSSSTEPGTGGSWIGNWTVFGSPSGTEVASTTISAADIPEVDPDAEIKTSSVGHHDVFAIFSPKVSLTASTTYWVVLEDNGDMTSSDGVEWVASFNDTATYTGGGAGGFKEFVNDTTDYWIAPSLDNDETAIDNWDFGFYTNQTEQWSNTFASGAFTVTQGQDSFLYLADNALVYWFVGRNVHTLDGGGTGGFSGRVNENVLAFPSYISVVDVAETRSRMYIGIQTSEDTDSSDDRTYVAKRSGIYVWDRRSQILGGTDFYPTPGAKEIKSVFTSSDGSVKAITVGNAGFTEIRAASGNQFAVVHTLERNAYPQSRRSVTQIDGLTVWLGANGIFYAYGSIAPGENEELYKIGDISGEANAGLITGPLFVGHEESSEPRIAVLAGWEDSDPSYVVQKWYPNGDGTINAVAQTGAAGNVYSKVELLPPLSTVHDIKLFGAPTSTDNADAIADVKIYFNMSSTPWASKSITKRDMNKGFFEIPVNKPNINFVQIEIEWSTSETLGADTLYPMYAIVDYSQVETAGGKTT